MKTEWHGDKDTPRGYGSFLIEGDLAANIYFESFTDYWLITQIIDKEVQRLVKGKAAQVRQLADELESEK